MRGVIRLLLVDDHAVLRAGLRSLLDAQSDMDVVGEAGDGAACLELAERLKPDVILLDLNMPGMGGLEVLEGLTQRVPESRVLVLTMHDDAGYLRQTLGAGSSGYVLKSAAGDELLSAVRSVHGGGTYLSPSHTRELVDAVLSPETGDPDGDKARFDTLSRREGQVFRLLALGHSNREIAELLFLSVKTVETYKARVMQKLGLKSRAALVRLALKLGVLSDEA